MSALSPWHIARSFERGVALEVRSAPDFNGNSEVVATLPIAKGDHIGVDARLLAAAPELLQALQAMLDMPEFDGTQETAAVRLAAKNAARLIISKVV